MGKVVNPWTATPASPPYVLDTDRPYVEAWNKVRGVRRERARLRLEILPEPAVGPRGAPLVLLGRNPGWAGTEPADHAPPHRTAALRANLADDPAGHTHPYLTEAFAETAGGKWSRRCMRAVVARSGLGYEDLARRVLSVEFHGYHSQDWAALPVTLPSQWYGFDLVARAIERGAIIVALRGGRDWDVAVPGLREYSLRFSTNTVRSASVSPGNLPQGVFDTVIDAIQR
jgi:hypothetical protein